MSAVAVGALADRRAVVASGDGDGTVRLWDPVTGAAAGEPLRGHQDQVLAVAVAVAVAVGTLANGRPVVASSGNDGTVRLWANAATGAAVGEPLRGDQGRVLAVAVGALAAGSDVGLASWPALLPGLVRVGVTDSGRG